MYVGALRFVDSVLHGKRVLEVLDFLLKALKALEMVGEEKVLDMVKAFVNLVEPLIDRLDVSLRAYCCHKKVSRSLRWARQLVQLCPPPSCWKKQG